MRLFVSKICLTLTHAVNTVGFYGSICIFMRLELKFHPCMCAKHASQSRFVLTLQHVASETVSPAYIPSHPPSRCVFSAGCFIALRQQTAVAICTIFHVPNQRGAAPPLTAAVGAPLHHWRTSHRNNNISIVI